MAVDLSEYVDVLRREVTPPGSDLFGDVGDEVFVGYLTDAFWDARLDGFLTHWTADTDGIVTPTILGDDAPDIPRQLLTLVIVYAGIKILRNRLLAMNTSAKYKAGPVEVETTSSAALLTEMLRQLARTRDRFAEAAYQDSMTSAVTLIDAYSVRQLSSASYGGQLASSMGEIGQIALGGS